ncbi:SLC13 family permease [Alkalimonas collagenimarina]|uniref:SLC13 family permease n=1 Tax=Alkalimonas collagenimarina TaxID=400390 RepID=A0ABT9GZ91_9GAMM|nr:SLC13 family permease [Alkalimonas collagenimarina]MDP4536369.1 SLC13 family permease [Alkalimonas collagenimarina]
MSLQAYALVGLLALLLIALVRFQQQVASVFGAMLLCLLALGFIQIEDLLRSAANPGLATLVVLVLISIALEKTSLLRRFSRFLFSGSVSGSLWRTMGFAALASSVLNNTAVVATLLSTVKKNKKVPPTKLLLPLSYAAIMGGTLTLIGTSTNLIVHSMLTDVGQPGFHFFDFTLIGLGVLAGGLVVTYLMAHWLPATGFQEGTARPYLLEGQLSPDSPLVGQTVEQAGLRHLSDLFLAEIVRGQDRIRPVAHYDVLCAGDKLLFSGDVKQVQVLRQFPGLQLFADENGLTIEALTEVIIKEESVLRGRTLKSAGFRSRFDAAVVAIRREGERVSGRIGDIPLKAGDFLLLATGPDFAGRPNISKNFFVLSGVKPHSVVSGWRESLIWWGFAGMILASAGFGVSLLTSALFLLGALIFSGCLSANEIKRRFPVEIWLVVTSALCIATTMTSTGLAGHISQFAADTLGERSVMLAFIGVLVTTYLLTELITNNAAAALMFPVAYNLASGMEVSYLPMVMAVAFAASASFVTPYGYQTNLMVYNASQYRLKHFMVCGVPVALTYMVLCIVFIPLVYPFY